MKRLITMLLIATGIGQASGNSPDIRCSERQSAEKQAHAFLALVDDGRYEAAWESTTRHYRARQEREPWLKMARDVLAPLAHSATRRLLSFRPSTADEPDQATPVAIFDYLVIARDGARHTERLIIGPLPAEECGVVRYQIDIRRIALQSILDNFVSNLNDAGGRLDYSDGSLIEIERVLMEHAPGGTPRAKQTKGVDYRSFVHFLGQYLGEVLIRHHDGQWSHTPNPGYKVPPWILMPSGRRIDPYQIVADYARQPAIGKLRQAVERELSAATPRP